MKNKFISVLSIFLLLNIYQQVRGKETFHKIQNGIQTECGGQNLKIQFYDDHTIRVVKWIPTAIPDSTSLVVIQKSLPDVQLNIQENDTSITIASAILQLKMQKKVGSVEFMTRENMTLLKENGTANIVPASTKNQNDHSIKQGFQLTPDEGIYGLGQHQYG